MSFAVPNSKKFSPMSLFMELISHDMIMLFSIFHFLKPGSVVSGMTASPVRIGEESLPPRFGISDLPPDSGDVTLDTCDDAIPYFVMDRKEGPQKQKNPKRGTCRARIAQTGRKGGWSASGEPGGESASPESGSRALTRRPEKRAWAARGWVSGSGALGQIGDLLQALLAV
uniref:Uncharacterized protein n=1 Tax=Vitis vinifera TaxID=29760 RepID=A5C2K7_VITVI|nr:hypothetical protein VITISV_013701 [Vitis vinifera]